MRKGLQFYLGILFFSLLISIPLLIPYIHGGYFPTHDGEWAVVRLSDMFREVKDLQFPPRYSANLNFGYGYPLFNFAYPFPYYLGLIFHILGLGFVDSVKLVFALSIPVSAFFMFLASRSIWKNTWAGIVSSVLYLYFPYRVLDLFVRGSIGESVAFALFPLILFCLSRLIDNPKLVPYKVVGGIAFGALIVSHNIMAVLFSLTLVIYFMGNYLTRGKEILKPFLFVGILGFALSAFFFVPALLEKHNILLSVVPIENRNLYFVSLNRLLFSKWEYGIPTDPINGFSYQLGWQLFLILITAGGLFVYQIYKKTKKTPEQILALTLFVGTLILSLFLFPISKPVWKIPILSEINYPWTMLSQLGLLTSLLAGYLVKFKYTKVIVIAAVLLGLIIYIPLAKPESYSDKGDNYYLTNDATTTSSSELMPLWVKTFPLERNETKVLVLSGNGSVNNVFFNSKKISFSLNSNDTVKVRVNTIYYPGWKAFDNNIRIPITYNNKYGVMDLLLPKGSSNVILKFSETPDRLVADLVSLAALIFAFVYLFKYYSVKFTRK